MHAHAHLTRPRLQTQCSTPARLEVNLAFGDFDFVVEVELHFERALFRNLALHGNCALGRYVVLVYVLLVDVDGHDHVCVGLPPFVRRAIRRHLGRARRCRERRGGGARTAARLAGRLAARAARAAGAHVDGLGGAQADGLGGAGGAEERDDRAQRVGGARERLDVLGVHAHVRAVVEVAARGEALRLRGAQAVVVEERGDARAVVRGHAGGGGNTIDVSEPVFEHLLTRLVVCPVQCQTQFLEHVALCFINITRPHPVVPIIIGVWKVKDFVMYGQARRLSESQPPTSCTLFIVCNFAHKCKIVVRMYK